MKEHKDKGNEEVKKIDVNPLSLRIFNVIAIGKECFNILKVEIAFFYFDHSVILRN